MDKKYVIIGIVIGLGVSLFADVSTSLVLSEQATNDKKAIVALELLLDLKNRGITPVDDLEYWYPDSLCAVQDSTSHFIQTCINLNATNVYYSRSGIAANGPDFEFTVKIKGDDPMGFDDEGVLYTTKNIHVWKWAHEQLLQNICDGLIQK